jgi:hypothetical protein
MTWKKSLAISAGIIIVTALALLLMGRFLICRCGIVALWNGDIWSNQNSQQFTDPYTFTHISHGIAFFGLMWLIARTWRVESRMIGAVALESAWEIIENTDFSIQRYRDVTISLDYYGDSVINAAGDIAAMMLGFWIASRLPPKAAVLTVVVLETVLLITVRDNLVLNIVMLFVPAEGIRQWQMELR